MQEAKRLPKARGNVPFSPRLDGAGQNVPSVCFKIPTGGGKTLLAAAAVSQIQRQWLKRNNGFVLWIVPNESIYSQTIKALRNREHPYRQSLDRTSAGLTKILELERLDQRDCEQQLCVMLLMLLQSAKRETKGDHLDNPDMAYKKKLFEICSGAFQLHDVRQVGEVELLARRRQGQLRTDI